MKSKSRSTMKYVASPATVFDNSTSRLHRSENVESPDDDTVARRPDHPCPNPLVDVEHVHPGDYVTNHPCSCHSCHRLWEEPLKITKRALAFPASAVSGHLDPLVVGHAASSLRGFASGEAAVAGNKRGVPLHSCFLGIFNKYLLLF